MLLACLSSVAQEVTSDSSRLLEEVQIEAYLYNRPLSEAPVSIGVIDEQAMERFGNTSLVPVLNMVPGVRMEERSPGSYRLAIRGSSIRSPFGVRNVKVYRNGLPITDGGGNTYLNLFDFSSSNNIELIKGPGGSLYGAGTGGVVLFTSRPRPASGVEFSSVIGSFGLQRYQVRGDVAGKDVFTNVNYSYQVSDGYREQTSSERHTITNDILFVLSPSTTLSTTFLYTDIGYGTPGGLTRQQFEEKPEQARPATPATRGAVEQNASVSNKTLYGGMTVDHEWSERFVTKGGAYFSRTDFANFAITNYEERDETNYGFRIENSYRFKISSVKGKFSFGGEHQFMNSPIDVFENVGGEPGAMTASDDLESGQTLLFAQTELELPLQFLLTLGASENWVKYGFERNMPVSETTQRSFSAVFSPRVALLKKVGNTTIYGSVSRGFSPPTLVEVRPSTNIFYEDLEAEKGTNIELGTRYASGKLKFDLTFYHFRLDKAIVLRRAEDGSEYFINSGQTKQNGAELSAEYSATSFLKLWSSLSYNHYRFSDYVKFDDYEQREVDYSGNALTGVAPFAGMSGADIRLPNGIYTNITYSYTARIPLNDLNDEYANDYFLLNARVGFRKEYRSRFSFDFFAAIDNAFDERYSLGNDLNAARRRFYNAAPPRNYSIGVKFRIL
jgi:iron complex outermembrane recepter protein